MPERFRYLIIYLDGSDPPVGTNDEQVAITANKDDALGVVDLETQTIMGNGTNSYPPLPIREQQIYKL